MRKPLVVREFDTIAADSGEQLNHGKIKLLERSTFEELMKYVRDNATDPEASDTLDFLRIGYKRGLGYTVSPVNYVGLIQFSNGNQVEILPKISLAEDDPDYTRTRKIFLKMLQSLRDLQCKTSNLSDLDMERMDVFEIFIRLYVDMVQQLVRKGIRSGYVNREENLNVFRGKLSVARNIRLNAAHRERFAVSHDEFLPERPENRLIKTTLVKLRALTTNAESERRIRQLLDTFEEVGLSVNIHADFERVTLDRNTGYYAEVIRWSRVFLENKSFTTFSGEQRSRALLFPMETVFESYVARQVRKAISAEGWSVNTQETGHWLFVEPRKRFALRPDIVCRKDGQTVIMDTKWKRLNGNPGDRYGISQADMYQMYAYAKKYGTPHIWLLYPMTDEMRNSAPLRFDSGDGVTVRVHFVDLAGNMEQNMAELMRKIRE